MVGPTRKLLLAERTALNILSRASGVATAAHAVMPFPEQPTPFDRSEDGRVRQIVWCRNSVSSALPDSQSVFQTFSGVQTVSEIHLAHCQCITISGVSKARGLAVGIRAPAANSHCQRWQCFKQRPTFSFSSHWQISITW